MKKKFPSWLGNRFHCPDFAVQGGKYLKASFSCIVPPDHRGIAGNLCVLSPTLLWDKMCDGGPIEHQLDPPLYYYNIVWYQKSETETQKIFASDNPIKAMTRDTSPKNTTYFLWENMMQFVSHMLNRNLQQNWKNSYIWFGYLSVTPPFTHILLAQLFLAKNISKL